MYTSTKTFFTFSKEMIRKTQHVGMSNIMCMSATKDICSYLKWQVRVFMFLPHLQTWQVRIS